MSWLITRVPGTWAKSWRRESGFMQRSENSGDLFKWSEKKDKQNTVREDGPVCLHCFLYLQCHFLYKKYLVFSV
jgi:hypothetical protein